MKKIKSLIMTQLSNPSSESNDSLMMRNDSNNSVILNTSFNPFASQPKKPPPPPPKKRKAKKAKVLPLPSKLKTPPPEAPEPQLMLPPWPNRACHSFARVGRFLLWLSLKLHEKMIPRDGLKPMSKV